MKKTISTLILIFSLFSVFNIFSQGFEIPKKPKKEKDQTSLYDYINLLTPHEKTTLEQKLIKYSDTTSTQIVVAVINSTEGENIGYLATNWAHEWGIGQEKEDNGVFILLAKNDRKITIRTGYGVEHLLTDYTSRQIIEYDILPYFKQGNYYGGLNKGVDTIFKVLQGEYKGTRKDSGPIFDSGWIIFFIILIIFFIIVSNGNKNNRGGGRRYRDSGGSVFDTIILSNSGRGGFGGGGFGGSSSSGGGGFGGGFGGGGFGGGGATGGW
ncbi:uncharacterized protein SAMN04489761_4535 [Tenacibaculum sp. MAR_2009_124]|uniref:TPM domain-containing protein n=1 Tax=Tenacibaculum sp. MAR_2009_124 TaxID=1250059 RepID=UPI000894BC1C|nr:TPM domain-containing protein [Tenacibaculum sp. MAR_2009_124]SED18084.1 uncharacterized protein SAMN04489761_4535 [Tenacibaculum sp. MAR_2009_124]